MKKILIVAILAGMVAAPAFAGLAPELASSGTISSAVATANPRSPAYAPNDAAHVYDNMQWGGATSPAAFPGGPDSLLYQLTQNPPSGGLCNLIWLRPGASGISSAHLVLDGRLAAGAWTVSLAFANQTAAGGVSSTWLNTTAFNFPSARYAFTVTNTLTLWTFPLPAGAIVTQQNIWLCVQGSASFRVRGGENGQGFPGSQFDGNPGDNAAANYIGSGSGILASSFGIGLSSANLYAPFVIDSAFTTGTRLGNWHAALGGTYIPEPATAALLGLIGLVALRRRKVQA